MRTEPRILPAMLFMLSGFVVWAVHFLFIYSFTGWVCERPEWAAMEFAGLKFAPMGVAVLTLLMLGVLAVAATAAGLFRTGSSYGGQITPSAFPRYLALGSAGLAAVAIIWEGLIPVMLVPACG
jgi:hypothetical protein